jgi:glycosyltransferase involved in cell wall biosynthesis
VIQRLDGMNWIHRRRRTGLAHFLRAEYGNLNLRYIRQRLADRVVYQSQFARHWWEGKSGLIEGPSEVIYNGVDLGVYNPDGPEAPPSDRWRILLVEGSLAGGYEVGLENAAELVRKLQPALRLPAELVVAGAVPEEVRSRLDRQAGTRIEWAGQLPKDRIPPLDRSAHLLFSADLNAACPNSVIEALACGLPVLSFSSGALPELVTPGAGKIVPYGGDPWALDPPDLGGLAEAGLEILNDQPSFRTGARACAVDRFGLEEMVARYLEVLG